jgi:hypothetical protein
LTTGPRSQCGACAHFRSPFSRGDGDYSGDPFCAAFPDGIPDEVYDNRLDHRQPIDGDHGVRWESRGGQEFPAYAFPGLA